MTEDDILYLQDIFLTNGMHAIKVPDVQSGRSIIYAVLQSLNFYQMVSCMTCIGEPPLKTSVVDVYSLVSRAYHEAPYEEIESFFIEDFFSDFLWIELSQDLINTTTLVHSFHALYSLDMFRRMPIIALSYL